MCHRIHSAIQLILHTGELNIMFFSEKYSFLLLCGVLIVKQRKRPKRDHYGELSQFSFVWSNLVNPIRRSLISRLREEQPRPVWSVGTEKTEQYSPNLEVKQDEHLLSRQLVDLRGFKVNMQGLESNRLIPNKSRRSENSQKVHGKFSEQPTARYLTLKLCERWSPKYWCWFKYK